MNNCCNLRSSVIGCIWHWLPLYFHLPYLHVTPSTYTYNSYIEILGAMQSWFPSPTPDAKSVTKRQPNQESSISLAVTLHIYRHDHVRSWHVCCSTAVISRFKGILCDFSIIVFTQWPFGTNCMLFPKAPTCPLCSFSENTLGSRVPPSALHLYLFLIQCPINLPHPQTKLPTLPFNLTYIPSMPRAEEEVISQLYCWDSMVSFNWLCSQQLSTRNLLWFTQSWLRYYR